MDASQADPPLLSLSEAFVVATSDQFCCDVVARTDGVPYVLVRDGAQTLGAVSLTLARQFPELTLSDLCRNQGLVTSGSALVSEIVSQLASHPSAAVTVVDRAGEVQGILAGAQLVSQLTCQIHELESQLKRSEQINEIKNQFLAGLSHEIRTSLSAILGYADMLLQEHPDSTECEPLETIRRNSNFLLEIANDILSLAKIEAGRLELKLQEIAPDQLVTEVSELLKVRASNKGIELRVEFPDPIPERMTSDPVRLRQILMNLISNAIKFTDEGGVTVRTRTLKVDGVPHLRIDVIDTGIGISPESFELLFEPYMQIEGPNGQRQHGTGLGLSISKELAEHLGGRIDVASGFGEGSTFSLSLPIQPEELELPRRTHRKRPSGSVQRERELARLRGRKCLLIDDRGDIRFLLQQLLERQGASVVSLTNGQEALGLISGNDGEDVCFDVILMDMQMPILDGFQTTQALRDFGCRIPIIAVTASAMDEDRQRCMSVGCDGYLSKPIDAEQLINAIEDLLRKSRSHE